VTLLQCLHSTQKRAAITLSYFCENYPQKGTILLGEVSFFSKLLITYSLVPYSFLPSSHSTISKSKLASLPYTHAASSWQLPLPGPVLLPCSCSSVILVILPSPLLPSPNPVHAEIYATGLELYHTCYAYASVVAFQTQA
jgi:hypothetical protein